ncbi:conserved hypothetical protein [Culex quinquefasciatus]|uniref:Uncharacterized protein n=1 Tax=Culex quinquefasciatus TaxID=7176 RepID=B0WQA8_CULQU|nr:conserved hypothetical protein [Culex quinquefasciatus]|eukprot:XP_001850892.1 conserved hypothetical protein [Culex quinquefasciatus]
MDVLLDAWDLVTTANASPPPTASPNQTTLSEDFHGFDFPSLSPSLPEVRSSPDLSPASTSSSSSSTSTSSSSFESAVASTPTAQPPVQQPRRSSREHLPLNRFIIIRICRRSDVIKSWSGLRCWKSSLGKPMFRNLFRFSNCLKLLPKSECESKRSICETKFLQHDRLQASSSGTAKALHPYKFRTEVEEVKLPPML